MGSKAWPRQERTCKNSSFSEEKEAKRLLVPGGRGSIDLVRSGDSVLKGNAYATA
jgi:hypothetical protein